MGRVLVGEVVQGGENGVGRRLSQAAEARVAQQVAEGLEAPEVAGAAQAPRDLVEEPVDLGRADAAGGADKLKLGAWDGNKWRILPKNSTVACPFSGQDFVGAVEVLLTRPWADPPVAWGG